MKLGSLSSCPDQPLSAASAGAAAAPAQGSVIGDWGTLGVRAHFPQGILVCCGERRLPRSAVVSLGMMNTLLHRLGDGKGSSGAGWGTGHVVPPLWMLGTPACPAQSFPGMCGSDWGGKVGSKCHPLGSEELPSLGAQQENVVLSLGSREGLQ